MSPYDQKNLTYRFATLLIKHPIYSILSALMLLGLLAPGLAKMQTDFSYRIWFRETDPLLERFDAFERQFGNDEMIAVIVHHPDGIFTEEAVAVVQDMTNDMWLVPEIIRVDSLSNYNWTHTEVYGEDEEEMVVEPLLPDDIPLSAEDIAVRREVALNHEVVPGYLVSEDGTTAVIYGQLKPAIGGTPEFEVVVNATREMLATYRADHPDFTYLLTGPAAVSHTFKEVTQEDMKVMVPMLLAAIVIFLLLSFRRLSGVAMPFVVIIGSLTMTLGFAGWVGIEFNNLTAVVPHILIAISVADAVHILVTFFQFRRAGLDRRQATHKTLVKNLAPTLLTSISTAIGFFSFSSAKIIPIVYMGILAGTGTLLAWFITIFLLTPMMLYLPVKVKYAPDAVKPDEAHPLAIRYARWLQRYRIPVMSGFAVTAVAAIYLGMLNEVNSNPFKYFAADVPTRVANEFAEEHVGGMSGFEIVIDSGEADGIKNPSFLNRADTFQQWLQEREHVSKTVSIIDIIKETNRSLNSDDPNAYVIPDDQNLIAQELFLYTMSLPQGMDLNNRMTLNQDKMRMTAMSKLHDSKAALAEIEVIEAKATELGLNAYVTGKMPLYHNMNPYVVSAFFTSIGMALILVAILMVFALRSVKLGLLSMIPNTMPLVFGAALMTILGKPLDIGTVLVASTCLGIAVDDTIHFLSNYNRWRKLGASPHMAVANVITHTGPALTVTTVVLVVAFATFAFASFVPNINFGILTAIVLTSALITDFTLLPAMLMRQPAEASVPINKGAAPAFAAQ